MSSASAITVWFKDGYGPVEFAAADSGQAAIRLAAELRENGYTAHIQKN